MSATDLASRIDSLESRAAIEELISGYAQSFDNHDVALLKSIWHPDAKLSLGAFGEYEGVDAIMGSAEQNWAQMPKMHHWMANAIIHVDGDSATGSAAVDCLCTHVEQGPLQISGLYRDVFERRDGKWAFVERKFDMHFLTPLSNWKPVAGAEASPAAAA